MFAGFLRDETGKALMSMVVMVNTERRKNTTANVGNFYSFLDFLFRQTFNFNPTLTTKNVC